MPEEELTLDDMVGFQLLPHNKWFMLWTGHWVGAIPGPTPTHIKIARATGGAASFLIMIYVVTGSFIGMLHGSGLTDISMSLLIASTTMSAIHKYSIFLHQEQGLSRIGRWVRSVNEYRKANNIPYTTTDRIQKNVLKAFSYSANTAPVILSIKMILTGETYNIVIPGMEEYLFHKILIAFSFHVMAWEVLVDASILMNSLFTFRWELMRIVEEWKTLSFNPSYPEGFRFGLKKCVQKHVEILGIFKDLKNFNNSMFGYQVFAAELTTCALIYGMAKGSGIMNRALVQILPASTASFLEFGVLCWAGEEIQYAFQQIHRSIYMTNWYEAPLKDKKSMTIVMGFSKNPITLTGFTVFTAKLGTFLEAMRQSFSLYTLLKTVL